MVVYSGPLITKKLKIIIKKKNTYNNNNNDDNKAKTRLVMEIS